jgi:hypothetical protein
MRCWCLKPVSCREVGGRDRIGAEVGGECPATARQEDVPKAHLLLERGAVIRGRRAASTTSRKKAVPKAQLRCVVIVALVVTALSVVGSGRCRSGDGCREKWW